MFRPTNKNRARITYYGRSLEAQRRLTTNNSLWYLSADGHKFIVPKPTAHYTYKRERVFAYESQSEFANYSPQGFKIHELDVSRVGPIARFLRSDKDNLSSWFQQMEIVVEQPRNFLLRHMLRNVGQ